MCTVILSEFILKCTFVVCVGCSFSSYRHFCSRIGHTTTLNVRSVSLLSVHRSGLRWLDQVVRLHSHKHDYEFGTVRVPIYEFRQTRVCMYFNGGHSHTYEYGLSVNFTRMSSFCAGRVFIQLVESKLLVNSINVTYKNRGAYLTSRLTSS